MIPNDSALPKGTVRVAAAVEYNGRHYCGWQRQRHCASVQGEIESALSYVADEPITVACAGRTDTGVHATNQIIHFDTRASRRAYNWIQGANSRLPDGLRIHWAAEVDGHFHARFAARSRTYRYIICNEPVRPAIFNGMVTWCRTELDADAMHRAGQHLLGENDFSSFRAAGCQSQSPFRNIERIAVGRRGTLITLEIQANAFLHHMVRNIAGALIAVGRGLRTIDSVAELLAARDRTLAEATAPAAGLYLVAVEYPDYFDLPKFTLGPAFVCG